MSKVLIQIEAWLPRPFTRKGMTGLTRKKYLTWLNAACWPVLYHDSNIILVKQFGSYSMYNTYDGSMDMGGYRNDHPKAMLIPEKHGRWRIDPESLKKLKKQWDRLKRLHA